MAGALDGAPGFPGAEAKGLMALMETDAAVRRCENDELCIKNET